VAVEQFLAIHRNILVEVWLGRKYSFFSCTSR